MDKQVRELSSEQPFLIMTLILNENQSHRFARIAKEKNIRGGLAVLGKGTVKSATLNLLGIKSQKKVIINVLLEKERAKEALDFFTEEFQFDLPGHGIAYTTPVITASQIINNKQDIWNAVQGMEAERMYKKLTVIVNRGTAEDVMDIAHKSGVKGGTIMHGRGTGSEFTSKLLGMEIEPEKELVMILLPGELVEKVANALVQGLQLDIPGNGVLFVEPVVDVRGLFGSQRSNKDTQ
jgi:nitrogen regulatory protein PII